MVSKKPERMTIRQSLGEASRRRDGRTPSAISKGIYRRVPARKTQKKNPIGQFPFFVMRFQKE
jgi:hypothetical protein